MSRIAILFGLLLACLLACLPCHGQAPAPDFPLRFDFSDSRHRWANQSPIDEHSVSEWLDTAGRTGGGIYMKGVGGDPDQMRVWRKVIPNPPIARRLHLRAWIKGAGVENVAAVVLQAHAPRSAYLAGYASTQVDQPMRGDFEWTELKTSIDVPRGCVNVQVLLMLVGNGEVWFDDVEIELGGEATLIVPGVFEVRGEFSLASAMPSVTTSTLLLPMPLSYRDQVPLAHELTVEPPAGLESTRVYEASPGNWVTELKVRGITTAPEVRVKWVSTVLAAPSDFASVPGAAPLPKEWPAEARPWLRATRSAQSDDPRIRAAAAEARGDSTDIMEIISLTISRARQIAAEQEDQCTELDAVQALTKRGSCTSAANLVAALLRASGVPARIVAGYPAWAGPHQTHFIVEAYVPGSGWYPIETSLFRAPWPSHQHIAVAIVPPENEDRSAVRPGVAGGVPYLSLTESDQSDAPIRKRGTLGEPRSGCDHECVPIRNFSEATSAEEWTKMKAAAQERWAEWLRRHAGKALTPPARDRSAAWYRTATEEEIKRSLLQE